MSERFVAYFERLERLSTEDLDRSVADLVLAERQNVAHVIAHLAEISRRKAELERGYPNLFEYCLRRLKLSEGSVALRIQVANVAQRFPQVLAALAEGRITLSVAGRLAPHLREENLERLLGDCAGMTKRAVEEYIVGLRARPVSRPSIRRLPSRPEREEEITGTDRSDGEAGASRAGTGSEPPPALEEASPRPPSAPAACIEPARPEVYNFRFAAGKSFREKLLRAAEVLGIENPERSMAEILEKGLDLLLEKKDPVRQRARRLEREEGRQKGSVRESRPGEIQDPQGVPAPPRPATSRYVPARVRERVLEKAGYRCEFRGPDGTRCTSRTGLEIEHAKPFAMFRDHDERFLEALCPGHNRYRAERVYGKDFIRRKIEERSARAPLAAVLASALPSP